MGTRAGISFEFIGVLGSFFIHIQSLNRGQVRLRIESTDFTTVMTLDLHTENGFQAISFIDIGL